MRCLSVLLHLVIFLSGCSAYDPPLVEYSREERHMGSVFQVTAVSGDSTLAMAAIDSAYAEIRRIESLISSWDDSSETSLVNRSAGVAPVVVSRELFDLVERCAKISRLTRGIFDITYASMDRLWRFDGSMTGLPSEDAISASIALVGYESLKTDALTQSLYLEKRGMKMGFGGIGKGYAANRCRMLMRSMGIQSGVVNAGGDLTCWGRQPDGTPWTIGIVNPAYRDSPLSWLEISDKAVVTSGNYERYVEFEGNRYCHIIDPRTGWPAGMLKSVTILSPDAELADALATSVFIMGVADGIAFVDRIKDVECLIVDADGILHASENIELFFHREHEK